MIALKLYPGELRELLGYVWVNTENQQHVPLPLQGVGKLVLLHYLAKWTPARIYAWQQRNSKKTYTLRLPVTVALALYQDMQSALLTGHQQLLLTKLDQALVNYQHATTNSFQLEAY